MAINMSYCMAENTSLALYELMDKYAERMDEGTFLERIGTDDEKKAALRLIEHCYDFIRDYGEELINMAKESGLNERRIERAQRVVSEVLGD